MTLPPELAVTEEPFSVEVLDLLFAEEPYTSTGPAGSTAAEYAGAYRWEITDNGSAEWACRHLASARAQRAELERQAAEWIDRINDWFDAASKPLDNRAAFFEARLMDYLTRRRQEDPRLKSLPLPSGTVKSRTLPPKVVVEDEETTVKWARIFRPDLVRVVESVQVSELRQVVKVTDGKPVDPDTGEVVPGTSVKPESVTTWVQL